VYADCFIITTKSAATATHEAEHIINNISSNCKTENSEAIRQNGSRNSERGNDVRAAVGLHHQLSDASSSSSSSSSSSRARSDVIANEQAASSDEQWLAGEWVDEHLPMGGACKTLTGSSSVFVSARRRLVCTHRRRRRSTYVVRTRYAHYVNRAPTSLFFKRQVRTALS